MLANYKFRVGQRVQLSGRPMKSNLPSMHYTVTRALPLSGPSPSYRIKGDDEAYERVAAESQLSPIF